MKINSGYIVKLSFILLIGVKGGLSLAQPANNCIFNAIDITSIINGVSSPATPFNCSGTFIYASAGNLPTRQDLSGDPNGCEICDITCSTKNPDHRDIWFRFTVSGSTPPTWLTVYNEQPEPGATPTFATAIYSGTPSGICGSGLINGLTQIDCSAGDILPLCISPAACVDGGGYGSRNKAICTTPIRPRIDISGLPNGTYYFRIWDWAGGTPDLGGLRICAESAIITSPAVDKCPSTNTIGCPTGMDPNADFDSTYVNQSNAGTTGNSCNTDPNEPQVASGPSTDIDEPCGSGWATGIGYINNVMNNSAIYRFEVNALPPCVARINLTFSNMSYGGRLGNAAQVQVMNSPCAGGSNAIMAWSTNTSCMEMRMAGNGTIPNGTYYVVVDGQDGQLVKYDLRLQITYSGAGCTPIQPNDCFIALPVELNNFDLHLNPEGTVNLSWSTLSEINNDYFTVERSKNGVDFESVAAIKGNGNSNQPLFYQTIDSRPYNGLSFYRLKQTDLNGKSTYFNTLSLHNDGLIKLGDLFPNPATDEIRIPLNGYGGEIQIDVTNLIGRTFISETFHYSGYEYVPVDISMLPQGIYFMKIKLENGLNSEYKFMKE